MDSSSTSGSCAICSKVDQNVFIKDRVEGMGPRTMAAFQESADKGCPRCKLMVDVLQYHVPEMRNRAMGERNIDLKINDRINLHIFPSLGTLRHSWAAKAGLDILGLPGKCFSTAKTCKTSNSPRRQESVAWAFITASHLW